MTNPAGSAACQLVPILGLVVASAFAPAAAGQDAQARAADLVRVFKAAYEDGTAEERLTAVQQLDDASRRDVELLASRPVAVALARGLRDESPSVVEASISALAGSRDVTTVVKALGGFMAIRGDVIREVASRIDVPDRLKPIETTLRHYSSAGQVLAGYREAAALDVLVEELREFDADAFGWFELRSCRLELIDSIMSCRCLDAFEAVIRHMRNCSQEAQRPYLESVSTIVRSTCFDLGLEPVGVPEHIPSAWDDWLDRNRTRIPKRPGPSTVAGDAAPRDER